MARRIAEFDWSRTPLGPRDRWSPALVTSLEIALASRFPMILWWGPELVVLYNDAYVPIFAAKHPGALGAPGLSSLAWGDPEVRLVIEPMLRGVLERGEATWSEDALLILERLGFPEETYFTWSYSPVRDGAAIVGVFSAVSETTGTVIRARRLRLLSELTAATSEIPSTDDVCRQAAGTMSDHSYDLPFTMLYLFDGEQPRLVATSGAGLQDVGPPPEAAFVAALDRGERMVDLRDLNWCPPSTVWPESVATAAILPLLASGEQRRAGVLVAGLSPRLPHSQDYLSFLDLLASRVSSAMSDARTLEDERRRAAALAELDRSKSVFFSNVSHEFRTPLTLMLGPLNDALSDESADWSLQRERLETARGNGLRLLKLVNSLLDFSRLEAGRQRFSLVPVDLSAATADLVGVFRSAIAAAGLTLEVNIDPVGTVDVDIEAWETVVFNLMSNALKYTTEGGVTVHLRLDDGRVLLEVADSGIGIDTAELGRIFDRFYRSPHTMGRSMEGTGIGLALVKELLRMQGGDITVESELGRGSVFTAEIPYRPTRRTAQHATAEKGMSVRAQSFLEETKRWLSDVTTSIPVSPEGTEGPRDRSTERPRVLVVDDNADMRRYLSRLLGDSYEAAVAVNGEDALAIMRRRRPDVVVSDVMMPVMDGLEMLSRIRDDGDLRDLPVLLLSARAGAEATLEGLEQGADDYLVKPFGARELLARVAALVETAARQRRGSERQQRRQAFRDAITEMAASLNAATEIQQVASLAWEALSRTDSLQSVTLGVVTSEAEPGREPEERAAPVEADDRVVEQHFGNPDTIVTVRARYRRLPLGTALPPCRAVLESTPVLMGPEDLSTLPDGGKDAAAVGVQSVASVPFGAPGGGTSGVLTLAWSRPVEYDSDLVSDLTEIADVAGRAVDRIRTYQLEREVTRTLQHQLLELNVTRPVAAIRAVYRPSDTSLEIGGDWYDVIEFPDGRVGLTVGDVVGRGLNAAASMSQLRSALAAAAVASSSNEEALGVLDRFAARLPGAHCATAIYAVIDTEAASVAIARAGHLPPLVVDPDGETAVIYDGGWRPLGIDLEDASPHECSRSFPPGSLIVLYTDGLVERQGESLDDGIERLRGLIARNWSLPLSLIEKEVLQGTTEAAIAQRDDVALLMVRTRGSTDHAFVDVIPAEASQLRSVRNGLASWLERVGIADDMRHDCILALGEAGANAIEHGSRNDGRLLVTVEAAVTDDEVVLTVTDSGTWGSGIEGFLSGRGRGHTIMLAVSDKLDVLSDRRGTVVTLRWKRDRS